MSRWSNWSSGTEERKLGFARFITEAAKNQTVIPTNDPAGYAQQQGWVAAPFGYYKDSNGRVVARSVEGQLVQYDETPLGGGAGNRGGQAAPLDTGNPAVTAGQTPADRARSMGLQSNGRGSYLDQSGNVVARTVNNELVFYDENGGSITDGGGGMALATSQPSWRDDVTGLIVVPPALPDTPKEIATIPDPTPAQAPEGYNSFINKKKLDMYAAKKEEEEAIKQQQQKEAETEQKFRETEQSSALYDKIQKAIEVASGSEDPLKQEMASSLKTTVETEADRIAKFFQYTPEGEHEKLSRKTMTSLIKTTQSEVILASVNGDVDAAYETGKYSEADASALDGIEKDVVPYVKAQMPKMPQEKYVGEELENDPDVTHKAYNGELVGFSVYIEKDGDVTDQEYQKWFDKLDINQNKNIDDAIRNSYVVPNPVEIAFDTNGKSVNGKEDRKKAAFEALKIWKREILPDLPFNTHITVKPDSPEKKNLYAMAGFGGQFKDGEREPGILFTSGGSMEAVVIMDENGKKVLEPIGDSPKLSKFEEAYINLVDQDLNIMEEILVMETLFG